MSTATSRTGLSSGTALSGIFLLGAAVAVSVGVYAKAHEPARRPLFTLGFTGMIQMKAWLTTLAALLLVVQLVTALWMWGKLPGAGEAPAFASIMHRWSGTAAFVLTLPVAFHCIWALGFATNESRVILHGILGCLFYGAYATKMLGLRVKGLPGWTLPVLGGTVLASLVGLWLTASLWFFTSSGQPLI
jgi:hypothetical protein